MTRALGHQYFSEFGVISRPSVKFHIPDESDRYLVLCSDGVTDVIPPAKVLNIIYKEVKAGGDMQSAAAQVVSKSLLKWKKHGGSGTNHADNTTAVVVDLKFLYGT